MVVARGAMFVFFCTEMPRTGCLDILVFCDEATREIEFSPRATASAEPTLQNSVTRSNMIPFILNMNCILSKYSFGNKKNEM